MRPAVVRLVATAAASEGRGHLARALALGEALASRELTVELRCLRGSLTEGERTAASAARIRLVDRDGPADLVAIDLPDPNEPVALPAGARRLVFDDRERLVEPADIVVQPSLPTWSGQAEVGSILAGYAFVPISSAVRRIAAATVADGSQDLPGPGTGAPPKILVCFGGSDPHGVTARLAPALFDGPWHTTVVLGAGSRMSTDGWPAETLRDPPDLPARLARCDVALLGAGTMKFEAACLARPAILVAAADDQLRVGEVYARTGAAEWLGDGRTIDPGVVRAAVERLVGDASAREAMSRKGRALVDGEGAARVAAAIAAVITSTQDGSGQATSS